MTQILLLIHVVMCSVTGAWVQADVFGLRPRLVFGGGTLHIMNECLNSSRKVAQTKLEVNKIRFLK